MTVRIKGAFYFLLGLLGLHSTPALADVLCLDGVQGETQSETNPGCIDVLAWSWGLSNSGTTHLGGGGGTGKANFQDLSVTKYLGKSSPILMNRVASGALIKTAELLVDNCVQDCKAGRLTRLTMSNILVTSQSMGGSSGEPRITENITLNFAKFEFCYRGLTQTGSPDTEVCEGWDIAQNINWDNQ